MGDSPRGKAFLFLKTGDDHAGALNRFESTIGPHPTKHYPLKHLELKGLCRCQTHALSTRQILYPGWKTIGPTNSGTYQARLCGRSGSNLLPPSTGISFAMTPPRLPGDGIFSSHQQGRGRRKALLSTAPCCQNCRSMSIQAL